MHGMDVRMDRMGKTDYVTSNLTVTKETKKTQPRPQLDSRVEKK